MNGINGDFKIIEHDIRLMLCTTWANWEQVIGALRHMKIKQIPKIMSSVWQNSFHTISVNIRRIADLFDQIYKGERNITFKTNTVLLEEIGQSLLKVERCWQELCANDDQKGNAYERNDKMRSFARQLESVHLLVNAASNNVKNASFGKPLCDFNNRLCKLRTDCEFSMNLGLAKFMENVSSCTEILLSQIDSKNRSGLEQPLMYVKAKNAIEEINKAFDELPSITTLDDYEKASSWGDKLLDTLANITAHLEMYGRENKQLEKEVEQLQQLTIVVKAQVNERGRNNYLSRSSTTALALLLQ